VDYFRSSLQRDAFEIQEFHWTAHAVCHCRWVFDGKHSLRNLREASDSHKTAVLGMVQRGGKVICMTVESVQTATLLPRIIERGLPASTVYTDELKTYRNLKKAGYDHHRINHSEKVYVSGDVHTNTIEGFWSLTKRGIGGVYHSVSKKHLQDYLSEYAWRYNRRHDSTSLFETLLLRAALR
jgi:transposase-like protein